MNKTRKIAIMCMIMLVLVPLIFAAAPTNPNGDTIEGYIFNQDGSTPANNASIKIFSTSRQVVCEQIDSDCCANCTGSVNLNGRDYYSQIYVLPHLLFRWSVGRFRHSAHSAQPHRSQ